MTPLRVLILRQDQVIDVHSFEDPRQEFVKEFNQLNHDTTYWAIIEEDASPMVDRAQSTCSHRRTCEDA